MQNETGKRSRLLSPPCSSMRKTIRPYTICWNRFHQTICSNHRIPTGNFHWSHYCNISRTTFHADKNVIWFSHSIAFICLVSVCINSRNRTNRSFRCCEPFWFVIKTYLWSQMCALCAMHFTLVSRLLSSISLSRFTISIFFNQLLHILTFIRFYERDFDKMCANFVHSE